MKRIFLIVLLVIPSLSFCQSNDWLTSLDAAKRLALVQDKMVLMIWEEAAFLPLPVTLKDDNGKQVFIDDLFENQILINLLRDYFILVKVNEQEYEALFQAIKNKRSTTYINKFNDDSIKILDVNGIIVNSNKEPYREFLNLTKFIIKYDINTSFIKAELTSYRNQQNFETTLSLASKYIELAIFTIESARQDIITLSDIYLDEAQNHLLNDTIENKLSVIRKIELLKIKQQLILNRPRKVLRQLKRIDDIKADAANEELVAFLYVTAYRILKDEDNAASWRSKISLINLKKSNQIISNSN
ncbi:MAG: hypothetical protein ACI9SD_000365 [Pseudohongiellaceae bacterium]|jgi:hypothetical protein